MDERIDLSSLELDSAERELLIAAILARADGELKRRAFVDVSPFQVLSAWARPALLAAAVVALLCTPVLFRSAPAETAAAGTGLSDALAVPAPADAWLIGERAPTVGDLLVAMDDEER